MHGALRFHDFSVPFALLLAHSLVHSITIFIIGYIIYTGLAASLISFLLHLLIFVVIPAAFHLLIIVVLLVLVLAPPSELHIAAVELDLGNEVCNGTVFFLILIDGVILERPLLFIQIERLHLLCCVAFLVSGALVRDWRVLASVAILSKEGYLLSCKHLRGSDRVRLFFSLIGCQLWLVRSDCVAIVSFKPTLNLLTLLLIFNIKLLLLIINHHHLSVVAVRLWLFAALILLMVHYVVDALVGEGDRWGGSIDGVLGFNYVTLFTRKSRYLLVTIVVVCHLQLLLTAKLN